MVSIKQLNDILSKREISPEEVDEAIDHLLMASAIHEIEDDCFIPDE
jgi:SOS response regulatory protein OraA/RecX